MLFGKYTNFIQDLTSNARALRRLRTACERELASYMRPSHIIPLDFIPLSGNGKADAKALAAVFLALDMEALTGLLTGVQPFASPDVSRRDLTDIEKKIVEVLQSYTNIPSEYLSPQSNLFECGLDSLAIARFAADVRRALKTAISPARIAPALRTRRP